MVQDLDELAPKQVLLLAPDLLGQSLALQLTTENPELDISLKGDSLKRHPSLVIWSIDSLESNSLIKREVQKLKLRWKPAPILLLLPSKLKTNLNQILEFECSGLLQDPDFATLKEAITTLLNGGRIVKLREDLDDNSISMNPLRTITQNILVDCINLIDKDLRYLHLNINRKEINIISLLYLKARRRELLAAKYLIKWFWSPLNPKFKYKELLRTSVSNQKTPLYTTDIVLNHKDSISLIETILEQLLKSITEKLENKTNTIFAHECLLNNKQVILMNSLLNQARKVLLKLDTLDLDKIDISKTWQSLQLELRQESLRSLIGNYQRLNFEGEIKSVSDNIISLIDLDQIDDELPDPSIMLNSLLNNEPIKVKGNYLSPDDPRSLIKLKLLLSNWLVRNTEIISYELINACSQWPDLRHFLLKEELIPTRELERVRNHLNSQNRFNTLIKKPIQLYESKRTLYEIKNNQLFINNITEPRDDELLKLDWWQRQVALLVEARDALAPQVQSLVRYIGNLMVVILTNVVGRALGLIGKGIAQGMGRTITNK